jgi:hypothetical protein
LALALPAGVLRAQESADESPATATATAPDRADDDAQGDGSASVARLVERLIERLGDGSFDVREAAAGELVRIGVPAREALVEAQRHDDLEVRLRARQLIQLIDRSELERRLAELLADERGRADHELPCWSLFRESIGRDRRARELYVEIARAESELLEAVERGDELRTRLLVDRVQAVLESPATNLPQSFARATLAAVLLASLDADIQSSPQITALVYNMLGQPPARAAVQETEHGEMMLKMVAAWFLANADNPSVANGLRLVQQYGLDDVALAMARNLLEGDKASASSVAYAALAVGKLGTHEDVSLLEPHLANKTVCHAWSTPQFPEVIKIEVRDVVLAVLVHLTGQEHKEYGFDLLQEDPTTLYRIYTLGFPENDRRETAMEKWRAWAGEKPNAPALKPE